MNIYDWRSMTRSINAIKPAPRMLQDLIFTERNTNPVDTIDVDIELGGREMAPFVTPMEGGVIVNKGGFHTQTIKTPRMRPKKGFTAQELYGSREAGQTMFVDGVADINAARARKIAKEQALMKNAVDTTVEWMCGQALSGQMVVNQENVAFQVDFLLPAEHKPTLLTTDKWDDEACDAETIRKQFEAWTELIEDETGASDLICIMGSAAASAFLGTCKSSDWFDSRRVNAGDITWNATDAYMGNFGGIPMYRYRMGNVKDASGMATKVIPSNVCVLVDRGARTSIEFGNILDLKAGVNIQSEYFSKSWETEDPSLRWILAESRPLPVLWQPGGVVYATPISA